VIVQSQLDTLSLSAETTADGIFSFIVPKVEGYDIDVSADGSIGSINELFLSTNSSVVTIDLTLGPGGIW
jgi:hypothetical protein